MPRVRRRFGPLFYGTLILGGIYLLGLGGWYAWPYVEPYYVRTRLARQLRSKVPGERAQAVTDLGQMEALATPVWLDAIRDPAPSLRVEACNALLTATVESFFDEYAGRSQAVQALLDASRDPDPAVRHAAVGVLERLASYHAGVVHEEADAVAQALAARLRDSDPRVRRLAMFALGSLLLDQFALRSELDLAPTVLSAFKRALTDDDPETRVKAATVVHTLSDSPAREHACDVLYQAACTPSVNTGSQARRLAFGALLAREHGRALNLVTPLREQLNAPSAAVRLEAMSMLGALGEEGKPALPELDRLLADSDPGIRSEAAATICQVAPERSDAMAELLATWLAEPESPPSGQYRNFETLLKLARGDSNRVVSLLLDQLREVERDEDRITLIRLLARLGPRAKSAVPALRALAIDQGPVSQAARVALEEIAPQKAR